MEERVSHFDMRGSEKRNNRIWAVRLSLVLEQSEKEWRITGNYLHEQLVWEALQSLQV